MTLDDSNRSLTRRDILAGAVASTAASLLPGAFARAEAETRPAALNAPARRPKVAAIFTELRFRSHAFNILENCFRPYLFQGRLVDPGIDVVSFYADQFPSNDMARDVSKQMGVPLYPSIDAALCRGGKELAVDAVLAIVEHGDYPDNALGQKEYPRKEFFNQSLAVMRRSGRYVPYFNDKHLSYRADWGHEMYAASREHGFPLMAGSSVPLAQRIPKFGLPKDAEIEEAISVHGGGMEVYGFHGLEVLQSIVEGRAGGETGIESIELLTGEAYRKAERSERWSKALADAAMAAETDAKVRRRQRPHALPASTIREPEEPHAILVRYADGLKATVLKIGKDSNRWNFACRLKGETRPRATMFFNGPWGNRCLFKALSHGLQQFFIHQEEPYPVERTLLTGAAIDAAMHSHLRSGKPISTPQLKVRYASKDFTAFRENGESWKLLTADQVEHLTFTPGDRDSKAN